MILPALLALSLHVGTAAATPNNPPIPIDTLAEQADQVIMGSVLTTRNNVDADGLWTVATVRVAETLRGKPQMIVEVRVPGGHLEDLEMDVMEALIILWV